MKNALFATAMLVSGCTYVTVVGGDGGEPNDASASDAMPDKVGVALDASPEAACALPQTQVSGPDHASCEPMLDGLCPAPSCGAYSTHYVCQNGDTPAGSHDDAGVANDLDCVTVDSTDFCCVQRECVHSQAYTSCGPSVSFACPGADAGSPNPTWPCSPTTGDPNDKTASFWCCSP